jgi:hypothetical protein
LKAELQKSVANVLELIKEVVEANLTGGLMEGEGGESCVNALRCLLTWIQFGVTLDVLEPIVPAVIQCVACSTTSESALEVLTTMLQEPCSCRFPESLYRSFNQVMQLESLIVNAEQNGATVRICS